MTDNKQFHQVNEATRDMVNSFVETSQIFANSFVSIQEHNLRWTQNLWLNWAELLTQQAESLRRLTQQWERQNQKQQEAFQRLTSASLGLSLDLLSAPLASQQTAGTAAK